MLTAAFTVAYSLKFSSSGNKSENRKSCFQQKPNGRQRDQLERPPSSLVQLHRFGPSFPSKDEDARLHSHRSNAVTRQHGAWQSDWALRWQRGRRPTCHGSYCYRWIRPFIHWRRREGEPMRTAFSCNDKVAAVAAKSGGGVYLCPCVTSRCVCSESEVTFSYCTRLFKHLLQWNNEIRWVNEKRKETLQCYHNAHTQ